MTDFKKEIDFTNWKHARQPMIQDPETDEFYVVFRNDKDENNPIWYKAKLKEMKKYESKVLTTIYKAMVETDRIVDMPNAVMEAIEKFSKRVEQMDKDKMKKLDGDK